MSQMLFSLGVILTGLSIGYGIQRLVRAGLIGADPSLERARQLLQRISLLAMLPVANMGAIWIFRTDSARLLFLPAVGFLAISVSAAASLVIGRFLKLGRPQRGAFFSTGTMSNLGAVGSLVVFISLGEAAYAMVPFYRLFELFSYYAIGFPVAKSFSPIVDSALPGHKRVLALFADPFVLMTLASIGLGLLLNLSGIRRPEFYSVLNAFLIPVVSLLLLMSIGMAMRFGRIGTYLREGFSIAGIKFIIVPLVVTGCAALLGFGKVYGGLPLKVVLIMSSMPVGFVAMVPPSIYRLDVDLANAAWLITTLLLALVIPLQIFILGLL
jgi:predicted permease